MDKWAKANIALVSVDFVSKLLEEVGECIVQEEAVQVSANQVGEGQIASYG